MQDNKNLKTGRNMKLSFVFTGKTKVDYIEQGISDYFKRLEHYIKTEIIIVPDLKNTRNMPPEEQMKKEAEAIMKIIPTNSFIILLDEKGKQMNSKAFAFYLNKKMVEGRDIFMIIGGAYGFSRDMKEKADVKISLSMMTFSHQMVRMILAEQVYRAFTIMRNEPYHHS